MDGQQCRHPAHFPLSPVFGHRQLRIRSASTGSPCEHERIRDLALMTLYFLSA
ncbi:hypothetical protein ACIBO9_28450 [Streptomyces prunicolor]|uniref:hypothetical protein n=1 Tax=Streptomyces prunicolor TaxID=67348 RepID=UPI0037D671F4